MSERVLRSALEYRRDSPRVELLLADDDDALRALVASAMGEAVDFVSILEAGDGAEAVRIGLQRRPQLALLDLNMPRLGGLEAAVTLRELVPAMRLALNTAGPFFPHERARELRVPLFTNSRSSKSSTGSRRKRASAEVSSAPNRQHAASNAASAATGSLRPDCLCAAPCATAKARGSRRHGDHDGESINVSFNLRRRS